MVFTKHQFAVFVERHDARMVYGRLQPSVRDARERPAVAVVDGYRWFAGLDSFRQRPFDIGEFATPRRPHTQGILPPRLNPSCFALMLEYQRIVVFNESHVVSFIV